MRITGWRVDGFGVFHDARVDDLGPGLTLFLGENEAGKSTLLAFLRGVLTGYPRGNSKEPQYPPLSGGQHGGRLFLDADGEGWVLERSAGRGQKLGLTRPDGSEGTEAELAQLLGHADRELYRNVFAFSLSELQELATLTNKEVQSRIVSAGITGAGRSAREAAQAFDQRADALFQSGKSKKPRAAQLLAELRDVTRELEERRRAASGYAALVAAEAAEARRCEELSAQRESARRRAADSAKLLALWSEVWSPLLADREALAKLEATDGFPVDGLARLEACLVRQEAGHEALRAHAAAEAGVLRQLEAVACDDALAASAAALDSLGERLALHRNHLDALPSARAEELAAASRSKGLLRELGSDWHDGRLLAFDAGAARVAEVRGWRDELRSARDQQVALARDAESVADRVQHAAGELDALVEGREGMHALELGDVRAKEEALGQLRVQSAPLFADEARLRDARARAEAAHQRLDRGQLPRWAAPLAVLTGLAAAGALYAVGELATAGAAGALGLGLATLLFALERHRERGRAADLAEAEEDCEALRQAIAERRRHLLGYLHPLGLDEEPTPELLERSEGALRDARERVAAVEAARRAHRACLAEQRALAVRIERAEAERADLEEGWAEWKQAAGVPGSLDPSGAESFFALVADARKALDERDQARQSHKQLERRIAEWEDEARRVVLRTAGDELASAPRGQALIERVTALRESAAADRLARQRAAELAERQAEQRERRAVLEAARDEAEQKLEALLAEGGAATAEVFRERGAADARRRELEARIAKAESNLLGRLGRGDEADELRARLEAGEVAAWESEQSEATRAAAELDARIEAAVRDHQVRVGEREALERGTELMNLELREASLREELRGVLGEWRRLKTASGLLRETLQRFERERQPEVLQAASRYFAEITGGRYVRIHQSFEDNGAGAFSVIDAEGRRKAPAALSRGTAEQLYLCIRLALVDEFARRSVALPVVMDDVLVNFDDRRARATAAVLADFARDHQLLFFTCSARTRELFAEVAPRIAQRELAPAG